jgi:hypothetical protein
MNTFADKTQKDKGVAAANASTRQQSSGTNGSLLTDNRTQAIVQKKWSRSTTDNPSVKQLMNNQVMTHDKGCGCSGCIGPISTSTSSPTLQAMAIKGSSTVLQLAKCPIHGDDPDYNGHSDRKCPDMQSDESEDEEIYERQEEQQPAKLAGWQKKGNSGAKTGNTQVHMINGRKAGTQHHDASKNKRLPKKLRDQYQRGTK